MFENKPEIADKEIKKVKNYLTCKVHSWDYTKFYKIIDLRISQDLFKGLSILRIEYIL